FVEHGYEVDVYSPNGEALQADSWSDPRDASKYSAQDLISLGFLSSPEHLKLVEDSKPISQLSLPEYDSILFVGGQGPTLRRGGHLSSYRRDFANFPQCRDARFFVTVKGKSRACAILFCDCNSHIRICIRIQHLRPPVHAAFLLAAELSKIDFQKSHWDQRAHRI